MTTTNALATVTGYFVEAATSTFTLAAGVQNDTVNVMAIKPGWTVIDVIVDNAALGASTTISLGDSGSATRYLSGVSTSSAAITRSATTGRMKKYTAADTLILLMAASATYAGAVTVTVLFVRDFS
jgi:hypothetical protein